MNEFFERMESQARKFEILLHGASKRTQINVHEMYSYHIVVQNVTEEPAKNLFSETPVSIGRATKTF